jgi:hypothetical protein
MTTISNTNSFNRINNNETTACDFENKKRKLDYINDTDLIFNAEYFLTKKPKTSDSYDAVFKEKFNIETKTIYSTQVEIPTKHKKKMETRWETVKVRDRIPDSKNIYTSCVDLSKPDGIDPWTDKYEVKKIDDTMGYGLFAKKTYAKDEIVGFYTGTIRSTKFNSDISYAFSLSDLYEGFHIDASKKGNATRYINHTSKKFSNIHASAAYLRGVPYIFFIGKRKISKGEELMYDYGDDYWKKKNVAPIIRSPKG